MGTAIGKMAVMLPSLNKSKLPVNMNMPTVNPKIALITYSLFLGSRPFLEDRSKLKAITKYKLSGDPRNGGI